MPKTRVHLLAKELGLESKELLAILQQLGINDKSPASGLTEEEVVKVKQKLAPQPSTPPPPPAPAPGKTKAVKPKEKTAKAKAAPEKEAPQPEPAFEEEGIEIYDGIPLTELALKLGINPLDIIEVYIEQGLAINTDDRLRAQDARIIAYRFGFETKIVNIPEEKKPLSIPRPAVVTVLGHVDHGKTLLLDAIRKTDMASHEAGGITQKIGASMVEWNNKTIVLIDTPGHEAFTAMRARGAKVTDIVVLVVAADDGVMPQTVEAINHARAARVPILVAVNKIDLPQANQDKVFKQLADQGLVPESWGGETVCLPVSAKKNIGIEDLLEMILLVTELQNLKAEYRRKARGTVIESRMDKGMGPIATVIVQNGTLKTGEAVVVGRTYGKIRVMIDAKGKRVSEADPSTPVEVIGLVSLAMAGDLLYVVDNEKVARRISQVREMKKKESRLKPAPKLSIEELLKQTEKKEQQELNLIVKADDQGSSEALVSVLKRMSQPETRLNIIHSGVGGITESDINLAIASKALILGFNVKADAHIKKLADQGGVQIRVYKIIYEIIEDIKALLQGKVKLEYQEALLGRAEVRAVIKIPKGFIAGCYVREGKIVRGTEVRLLREGEQIYQGKISSLRRFKEDVKEVTAGFECGIGIEKYTDLKAGDLIEAYHMVLKTDETTPPEKS